MTKTKISTSIANRENLTNSPVFTENSEARVKSSSGLALIF